MITPNKNYNVSEEQIIDLMLDASDNTIEVALCCCEQGIDDFISAYYEVVMHNVKFLGVIK